MAKKWWQKALGAVGDVGKFLAPAATFIPGVGPVAAGLIGAGGAALGKLNDDGPMTLGTTLPGMVSAGAAGYGGAKLADRFTGAGGSGLGGAAAGLLDKGGKGDGGRGMDLQDWLTLGTAGAGALAGGYGAYQEGKLADQQMADDRARFADATAFRDRAYGDERADVQFGRDQNRRSGVALNPMLAGLLGSRGNPVLDDDEELRRKQAVQMES